MPVKVRKLPKSTRYRVAVGGRVTAKSTTKTNATRQANLLRGVMHGWKPGRRSAGTSGRGKR